MVPLFKQRVDTEGNGGMNDDELTYLYYTASRTYIVLGAAGC